MWQQHLQLRMRCVTSRCLWFQTVSALFQLGSFMLTMQTILDGGFAVLEGALFVLDVYLSMPEVYPQKKIKSLRRLFSSFLIVNAVRLIAIKSMIRDQVSAVPSAACLRVWSRLLDGWTCTKIEASAASPGTSRFRPWNADALCEGLSREVLVGIHGLWDVWNLTLFMMLWDSFMGIST